MGFYIQVSISVWIQASTSLKLAYPLYKKTTFDSVLPSTGTTKYSTFIATAKQIIERALNVLSVEICAFETKLRYIIASCNVRGVREFLYDIYSYVIIYY